MVVNSLSDIKARILNLCMRIDPLLGTIIDLSEIAYENGKIVIKVPSKYSHIFSELVKKHGEFFKKIENELNIKFKVMRETTLFSSKLFNSGNSSESEQLRWRLRKLKEKLPAS